MEIGHGGGAAGESAAGPEAGQGGTGAEGGTVADQGGADAQGEAGSGESNGATSNGGSAGSSQGGSQHVGGPIPADTGPQVLANKVDLLIAVDNSISMAEKQKLFAQMAPELVMRLVNPPCVSSSSVVTARPSTPEGPCPAGSEREFEPVRDLHVGVITSSLGSHGADGVGDVCVSADDDDKAHLLGTRRDGVTSYDDAGYLKWDPDSLGTPPGESDAQAFADALGTMILSAGETGCGYEAQLESIYRFLVDPEPPAAIEKPDGAIAVKVGVDTALLEQRERFLRPDSSVVVVMLTDENDCSVIDEGYGWLLARSAPMYRSTSACLDDPNDPCCQSCGESMANPGCEPLASDSECQRGLTHTAQGEDDLNLRCFEQKRRFGFDLLYPLDRYVSGFGGGLVRSRSGALMANPLFQRGEIERDPSLFTFAMLGGVPWQDIASPDSLTGETLRYLTPAELAQRDRWDVIVGDPQNYVPPSDPFMRESAEPRTGINPITGDPLVSASSTDPRANDINGHEQLNLGNTDLQHACAYRLPEPLVCDKARQDSGQGCDCFADSLSRNSSLCQPPGGGAATTTQYYAKAYPALRELAVAKALGRRTVLGSICARNTQDEERTDYGYRPAFDAIGGRVASTLTKP